MTGYIGWFFILFLVNSDLKLVDAQLQYCPQDQITFEKLIGVRPNLIQQNSLLYRSTNNTPVTLECLTKCANNVSCTSFLLYYNISECHSYANETMTTQNYDYDSRPDTNVVWFRKTCLNACKTKAWSIEILAGATLVGSNTKRISYNVTRQRCIEFCIQETNFPCKSIKFSINEKSQDITSANPRGYCVLSNTDRHLTPNGFRVSRYEDEYIENQCVDPISNSIDYCAYEEYEDTLLEHTDLKFTGLTQLQCQEKCEKTISFNCRGYSTVPFTNQRVQNPVTQKYTCLLHSEDSKLIGPKLLVSYQGAKYYERARCLNVSVTCTNDLMTIIYQPEQVFTGRIYTNGYSDKPPCYADGHNNASISLKIPLNRNLCGLVEAYSSEPVNRTLKSVLIVIQYNALIQTQADRLIKVGCVYGNEQDNDPEITLGTSVNFTNGYPSRGSTIVNSSSVLPIVTMRIIDYNTKQPTSDTEIGQELEMIIEITPGPYDIWASNLIATSGNYSLQLLDANGCPTYPNLFARFTKIHTNRSTRLITNFQAFKFPITSLVRFSVMIHFCTVLCDPIQCADDDIANRIKRATVSSVTNDTTNATVHKVYDRKDTTETNEFLDEMPLDILLRVRGVNLTPDQLVYSENNRILVAGYDYVTNEVCVDYSLFVGLIITWILLQIILVVCCVLLIRKYKKYFHIAYTKQLDDMHQNFAFESRDRRVHWADQ